MKVLVQRKSLGHSRKLEYITYELPEQPHTLRELLTMLVQIELAQYNEAPSLLALITDEQQEALNTDGYVKFSSAAERPDVENSHAITTMLGAFR